MCKHVTARGQLPGVSSRHPPRGTLDQTRGVRFAYRLVHRALYQLSHRGSPPVPSLAPVSTEKKRLKVRVPSVWDGCFENIIENVLSGLGMELSLWRASLACLRSRV